MLSVSITSPSVPLRPRRIVAIRLEDLNLAAPSIGMLPALPPVPFSSVRLSNGLFPSLPPCHRVFVRSADDD